MPITIQQSPTTPNMANADLIYVVTSTTSSSPQYQFVCDVRYSGSATVLQRVKQQPNPNQNGVFNVGQILTNYLDVDPVWKTNGDYFATSSNASKQFIVAFGEEYGSSTSSSVTLYTGIGTGVGNPGVSSSNTIFYINNGLVEPNSGDWNFPSASYYTASYAGNNTETFQLQNALTNAPTTQKIQDGEYHTLSLYNGNFDNSPTYAQDIYSVVVSVYDSSDALIKRGTVGNTRNNGGGPRDVTSRHWSASQGYASQTPGTRLLYFGSGPQNLATGIASLPTNWSYYTVEFVPQRDNNVPPFANASASYATFTFTKDTAACDYEGVRFAWKNEFGVWDYYTARLATNSGVSVERNSYQQSFVDYSTFNTTIPYNVSRRGDLQFYNQLRQSKTVTTDYLNQADADWIRELIFSPSVFVQEGSDFLPVVITNAEVTEKTNPRSQKLFNYDITFAYANQLRPRL